MATKVNAQLRGIILLRSSLYDLEVIRGQIATRLDVPGLNRNKLLLDTYIGMLAGFDRQIAVAKSSITTLEFEQVVSTN